MKLNKVDEIHLSLPTPVIGEQLSGNQYDVSIAGKTIVPLFKCKTDTVV